MMKRRPSVLGARRRFLMQDSADDENDPRVLKIDTEAMHSAAYPFTPPAVRPDTRCFSMNMNRITTGMVASTAAANR